MSSPTITHNVGKFNVTTVQFEWKIRNFSSLGSSPGDQLVSPVFFDSWLLVVCPRGHTADSADYVSVFLANNRCFPVFASFSFTLLDHNGKRGKSSETSKALILKRVAAGSSLKLYGNPRSFKRSLLQNPRNQLLVNDALTILCEIRAYQDCISVSSEREHAAAQTEFAWLDEPATSFGRYLNSAKFSDVSFSVAGVKVCAHRNILSARSPVFERMLDDEGGDEITIENVDHVVFIELLRFIYTGRVNDIAEAPEELMLAAKRYSIDGLRELCERAICDIKHVRLDNALSYLSLADTCAAERLKRRAMEFVERNPSVIKTAQFVEFAKLHSELAAEVVERVANVFYEVDS